MVPIDGRDLVNEGLATLHEVSRWRTLRVLVGTAEFYPCQIESFAVSFGEMESQDLIGVIDPMKRRSQVWTEAEALADTRKLFSAALSGEPQRVQMSDLSELVVSREHTAEDAASSHAFLSRRPAPIKGKR